MESVQIQGKENRVPFFLKPKPPFSPLHAAASLSGIRPSLSRYCTGYGPGRLWISIISFITFSTILLPFLKIDAFTISLMRKGSTCYCVDEKKMEFE